MKIMKKRTNLLTVGGLTSILSLSGVILTNPLAFAGTTTCSTDSNTGIVTCNNEATTLVRISITCSIEDGGGTYNQTVANGTAREITANQIEISCNDTSGFSVYAIGYSGDTDGGNKLVSSLGSAYDINTGTSGTATSWWAMKTDGTYGHNSYDDFNTVPSSQTEVLRYPSSTGTSTYSFTPSYKVYISGAQAAGTYTGKVKYTLVHPAGTSV